MKLFYDFIELIHNPTPQIFFEVYVKFFVLCILFRFILGAIVYLIEILKK